MFLYASPLAGSLGLSALTCWLVVHNVVHLHDEGNPRCVCLCLWFRLMESSLCVSVGKFVTMPDNTALPFIAPRDMMVQICSTGRGGRQMMLEEQIRLHCACGCMVEPCIQCGSQ